MYDIYLQLTLNKQYYFGLGSLKRFDFENENVCLAVDVFIWDLLIVSNGKQEPTQKYYFIFLFILFLRIIFIMEITILYKT